ncbi:MAG: glycosyl transferase [Betaproteobacteria bacterium RIFCSPLOWO2_12_FULL_66_14]|nr:MAG: glycosyl transferase [Betaproteobacteria bacterium RIFCSPLOWO2_12_FULL_66_14]
MTRISIVVPVLNEAGVVAAGLAALAEFRARGCELIVVDGASTDGTAEIARPFADRVLISDPGRARQMNAGAGSASGDILIFLHVDTRLPELAHERVRAGIETSGCVWGRFDANIEGAHPLLGLIATMMNWRSRLTGIATGDQAMFVTRAAFRAAGGFPAQPLMEDIALSKALKRLSPPLCLAERVTTSGRRWERHGIARTILFMWWLRLRYFFGASPALLARTYYGKDV